MTSLKLATVRELEKKQTKGIRLEDTFYKKPIIHSMDQNTPEWDTVRLAKVTASNMDKVKSSGSVRMDYMLKLIGEKRTGQCDPNQWNGKWAKFGHEYEPQARACHALTQGIIVKEVGFIEVSPDIGFSPDGLIGRWGLLEIKCRSPKVQLATLLAGRMPPEERWQIQFELCFGKRKWCDYVSFCPFMKKHDDRYFYRRILRNESIITAIRSEVTAFLNEMVSLEATLDKTAIAKRALITA